MKIVYVSDYYPGVHARSGGGENHCRICAETMREAGADVEVFTVRAPRGAEVPFFIRQIRRIEDFLPPFAARMSEIFKYYAIQRDPVAEASFSIALDRARPDVVHFCMNYFLTYALVKICRRRGIPTVLSVCDYWFFCPLSTLHDYKGNNCRVFHGTGCINCLPKKFKFVQKVLLSFRKKIFDSFLNAIDIFVVFSEASATLLTDYRIAREKIWTMPATRVCLRPQPSTTIVPDQVLFIGWLQPRKGLDIVLKAMPAVLEKRPGVRLEVIANNVRYGEIYEKKIKKLLSSHVLKGKVKMSIGVVSRSVIEDSIDRAAVCVIAEQWENMCPLILAEYLASGKTIVAGAIGGIPEFITDGKTGYLFKYDDPASLARALLTALDERGRIDPEAARALAREKFSATFFAERLSTIYASVSRGH